ncbi:MAG: hypothetical protein K0R93_2472 [Anaerosolibacter sp.]|uniref:DUF2500 domain-containing protein n=1 Tax=Anaerosolibacter sp. TaxID=1872527 RepID=UPI0026248C55|nr:DUF2500 domain-containing protein [Anaerosolibacter sp.]MDF2547574.1 hypothetical protein [Anaerosolibacter sp.]
MYNTGPFDMFSIIPIIVPIFFIFVFGMILFTIFRGIKEWSYNNKQPILTVDAKIVAKRAHTSRHTHNHNNHMSTSSSTSYYVTFEVESGDRMELHVPTKEYGLLADGDHGKLTFQGTRYHGFERR